MSACRPAAPPLAKVLALRDGQRVWFEGMPESVADEIGEYALDLIFVGDPARGIDAAHIFVTDGAVLAGRLAMLRKQVAPDGHVWVSWPVGSTADGGELDEEMIREIALPLGFVDTKSCPVDDAWHGLKLVIRKELR